MSSSRLEALRSLACAITAHVPELTDRICIGQAAPDHDLEFPHLVIDPVRWRVDTQQAKERFDSAPDRVVMDVGVHVGTIQLRIGTDNDFQRWEIAQRIIDLFLAAPLQPGVLTTTVSTISELGTFQCSWVVDEDEFVDEAAFERQLYSVATVSGNVPALVTRADAHTIRELRLVAVSETDGLTVTLVVDEDGGLEPA